MISTFHVLIILATYRLFSRQLQQLMLPSLRRQISPSEPETRLTVVSPLERIMMSRTRISTEVPVMMLLLMMMMMTTTMATIEPYRRTTVIMMIAAVARQVEPTMVTQGPRHSQVQVAVAAAV
jgi:hypothetical protein